MKTFYKYSSIIRVLDINEDNFSKSHMIDIDIIESEILSNFDASLEFDANFIKSFIDLMANSKTGFIALSSENLPASVELALRECR